MPSVSGGAGVRKRILECKIAAFARARQSHLTEAGTSSRRREADTKIGRQRRRRCGFEGRDESDQAQRKRVSAPSDAARPREKCVRVFEQQHGNPSRGCRRPTKKGWRAVCDRI